MLWLELGSTKQLTPVLNPETAKVTYNWESSATEIATVDQNGVVRPVTKGTATISVTATFGNAKLTASVDVKVVEPNVVAEIIIGTPNPLRIKVGEIRVIDVQVKPDSAYGHGLIGIEYLGLPFSAHEDKAGIMYVEGVQPGTGTVTIKDYESGVAASLDVIVTK